MKTTEQKLLSNEEIASFCNQAAMLFQAGIPPVEGMAILQSDAQSPEGKAIFEEILTVCRQGESFHKALEATKVFPDYCLHMIALGEESGNLDVCMSSLADYYEKEIGYHIPSRTPFVGSNFNVTRAGIHADGLLKNEEIYNIFDTEKFLNRPVLCAVSNTSGLAGIAHWINTYFGLKEEKQVDKNSKLVDKVKEWVDKEYESGRVTVLTDEELLGVIDEACKKLGILLV